MKPHPFLLFPFLLLLCTPSLAVIYKCAADGAVAYADQPCPDTRTPALQPAPLPTSPALKFPQAEVRKSGPAHRAARKTEKIETAGKRKCDRLALRRRWAEEDLREAGTRPLRAQDKSLEIARRKARRADEQYRLECAAPS